jgi:hypothetical protein
LQTTAADALAAVNVSAVTASTRALLMLFITFSVAFDGWLKRLASEIVRIAAPSARITPAICCF